MRYVLHEVRTPLAQIIGYSEMLQDEAPLRLMTFWSAGVATAPPLNQKTFSELPIRR
jgi:signal transduction histidine kinase